MGIGFLSADARGDFGARSWNPNGGSTCLVGESEDHAAVGDAAHISDGGHAAVVGVVLRTQVLQLQNLRFPLQLGSNQHWCANVCKKNSHKMELRRRRKPGDGSGAPKGQTPPQEGQRDEYGSSFNEAQNEKERLQSREDSV